MAGFDMDGYLRGRAGGVGSDKLQAVQAASQDKRNGLLEASRQIEEAKAVNANAWSNKLGLDVNSIEGSAVNLVASMASGASRVGGQIAALPADVSSMVDEWGMSEQQVNAYNRYLQKSATPEDIALLSQKKDWTSANTPRTGKGIYTDALWSSTPAKEDGPTILDVFERAANKRQLGRDIVERFDISKVVNQEKRQALSADLGDTFQTSWDQTKTGFKNALKGDVLSGGADTATGLAKLLYNAGEAAVSNPGASGEYVFENIPQLALGLLGKVGKAAMATSNVGYAADNYQKGVKEYQASNDGKLPPAEMRQEMAMWAASTALAEQAGDMVSLGLMKVGGKGAADVARIGFKESLKNTGKAAVMGTGTEAVTEGYQTFAEGEAGLKPASALQIYEGATIGGIAGGGLSGGGRAVAELAGATPEQVKEKAKGQGEIVTLKAAIDSNDTSAYLDPASSTYSPAKAAAVHFGNSQKADTTPEAKEANLTQANKIVTDLESRISSLKDALDTHSPDSRTANEAALTKYTERLATLAPTDPRAAMLKEAITGFEEVLATPSLTPAEVKAKGIEISKLERELGETRKLKDGLHTLVQPKDDEIAALVELSDTKVGEASSKAAERIITLAMNAPEKITPEMVQRLVDNTENSLTESQRSYLRVFSAAKQAEHALKSLSDVENDIYIGSHKPGKTQYMGIADYNSAMSEAITAGNSKAATRHLNGLTEFARNHQSKVDAGKAAIASRKPGTQAQIVYNKESKEWEVAQIKYSDAQIHELGGFTFSNPEKSLNQFETEANALNTAVASLKAAYELKFNPVVNTVNPSKPSKQPEVVSVQPTITSNQSNVDSSVDSTNKSTLVAKAAESTKLVNKDSRGRTQPKDYDNLVGAILRATGGKGINSNMSVDLTGDDAHKAKRVRSAFSTHGTQDIGELVERLRDEEDYDVTDATHLSDLLREHEAGNPVLSNERMREEAERNDGKKYKEYVRGVSQQAKDLGLKGVRGRRTLGMVEADIARLEAERNTWEAEEEHLGKLMEEMDSLVQEASEADMSFDSIQTEVTNATQSAEASGTNEESVAEVSQSKTESSPEEQHRDGETQTGESTVEPTQSDETSEVTPEGTLGVFKKKYNRAGKSIQEVFQKMNLVAEYLVQKMGKDTDTTQRPLVAVKDFLAAWNTKEFSLEPFLGKSKLSSKQEGVLKDFKSKANEWLPLIQANFVKGAWVQKDNAVRDKPEFYYTDPVQFLIEQYPHGADTESNVKLAIAHAAYSWIAENSGSPSVHTREAVKEMFGVKEYEKISNELYHEVFDKGSMEKAVMNSMGQKVTQALGLATNSEASQDFLARLESGFGAHVAKLLLDQGIIERTQISSEIIAAGLPDKLAAKTNSESQQGFIRFARTAGETSQERKLKPVAEGIAKVSKGTGGILGKMFGVESDLKFPEWEPIKSRQKTTKNTDQGVPGLLQKYLTHENSVPSRIRQDTWGLFNVMDKEAFLTIAGYEAIDPDTMHALNLESTEATNEALEREYDRAEEYFTLVGDTSPEGLEQPLYFDHTAWKQQRVGIATNGINPQTSKLQRWMLYRPEWETEVLSTDTALLDNFRLRVAEGLGIKTDKQGNEASLTEFAGLFDSGSIDPKVVALRKAVQALQTAITAEETLSPADQQAIVAGVAKGGSKMHSLDALIALAHYENAKAKAKEGEAFTFTVQMMGEVDGVTNGPMLSHLLLGAANSAKELFALLNKGGFFREQDGFKNYNLWRGAPEHSDLYETTISHVLRDIRVRASTDQSINELLPALWAITGQLDNPTGKIEKAGRNIIKTPLTAMLFGSAIDGAISSMFDSFVDTIYDGFEKVAQASNEKQEAARVEYLKHLNTLLRFGGSKEAAPNVNVEELLQFEFSKNQKEALKKAFDATLGNSVAVTMESYFSNFIDTRKQVNETAQATFALYDAAYQGIRTAFIEELMEKGDLPYGEGKDGRKLPRRDLKKSEEKLLNERVKAVNPVVHTYFSKESKQDANSGLHISKSSRKLSTDPVYRSQVKFNKPFENGAMSIITAAYQRALTAPGVAMLPMMVHSLDSAISHMAAFGTQVLNVHDAHGSGLKHFTRTAQRLNEATWKATLNYSPASEIRDAWVNTLTGMTDLLKSDQNTKEVVANLKATLGELGKKYGEDKSPIPVDVVLQHVTDNMYLTAYTADRVKYETMKELVAIDQYALEGGQYDVTEADRNEAAERLASLVGVAPTEVLKTIELINKAVLGEKAVTASVTGSTQNGTWGELGTPKVKSDKALVTFFEENQTTTAADAIQLLEKQNLTPWNKRLLTILKRTVNKELSIRYVTSKTPNDNSVVISQPVVASHAWYSSNQDTGKEEIYLLSTEHTASGLTVETLLHEMVHASLLATYEQAKADVKHPAHAIVEELRVLRKAVKAYMDENGLTKYASAVGDVHEMIAWGMTNEGFQTEVLNKVSFTSSTQKNSLITGMQKFIDALSRLFFWKPDQRVNSGMSALISNVSGLFYEAGTGKSVVATANQSMAAPLSEEYTTQAIYEALDNHRFSPSFNSQLQGLLNGIVTKLHGPYGAFKDAMQGTDPLTVWLDAKQSNAAPFASKTLTAGFPVSEQEAFVLEQVEATVRTALEDSEGQATAAYKELTKLFMEARNKLTVADFETIVADPQEAAKLHNFVFNNTDKANGERSDYLARFAALGLAHEGFNQLLNMTTQVASSTQVVKQSFSEKLQALFEQLLDYISHKVTNTYAGQKANDKLNTLVNHLVNIEAKKRSVIKARENQRSLLEPVEEGVKKLTEGLRYKIGEFADSGYVQNRGSAVIRATGKVVRIVAHDQVDAFMNELTRLKDRQFKGRQGMIAGLLREITHNKEILQTLHRAAKLSEAVRKDIITHKGKEVLGAFKAGKAMNKEAKAGITASLLRTGAHVLTKDFSMAEIQELLADRKKLDQAIKTVEAKLSSGLKDQHIRQANTLGLYRATGKVHGLLMLNSHLIARMSGTPYAQKITEQQAIAEEAAINTLASLYGIKYTHSKHANAAAAVMATENERTDGNGIEFTLALHQRMEQESREKLFKGNPALMVHGFTPEILNPHTDIKFANAAEGKELIQQGYELAEFLPADPKDPTYEPRNIYVLRDGGLARYVSGAISTTNNGTKGDLKHNGDMNPLTVLGRQNAALQSSITTKKMDALMTDNSSPGADLSLTKQVSMAPVYNDKGEIVNWRYLMKEAMKDSLLERDSSFERVLGSLAGTIYDKVSAPEQNRKAIEASYDLYQQEMATESESYVLVGEKSTDPDLREIWRMLPDSTKEIVSDVWNMKGMYVRSDSLDITFGYRKHSMANVFKEVEAERKRLLAQGTPEARKKAMAILNPAEKAFVMGVEMVMVTYARAKLGMTIPEAENYAKRAAVYVTRGERAWQEVYREFKDIVVVKSGMVLVGNIYSNFSTLVLAGVPWKDILRNTSIAMKGATAYHQDNEELSRYRTLLDTGYTQGKEAEIKWNINRLEDAIARNPVKQLIDAGLMPTIVDDVESEEDTYSYKSHLTKVIEDKTSWVNPKVKAAAKVVYMAKDTKMYQGLSRITQLSDFTARYALYQHLTTQSKAPLAHEDAIQKASDYFVNYDTPMQKGLQYIDDMGFTPFIKYFLRIQKPLLNLTRENPARVLSALALGNFINLGPIVLEGSGIAHLGNNPFASGAMQYPWVLDDLGTVQAGLALVN